MSTNDGRCLGVIPGRAKGRILFSDVPLSFMMGVNLKTGFVADVHHPLYDVCLTNTVVVIPSGRGSCSGSSAILELLLSNNGPAALIFRDPEMILTLGVLVAQAMFDRRIPVIFLSEAVTMDSLRAATWMQIDETTLLVGPHGRRVELMPRMVAPGIKSIDLTEPDEDLLSGKHGEAARTAMEIIVSFATIQGATRLVSVSQVHVDACAYVGKSSLQVPERLLSLGGKFVVPTTCNALNVDRQRWRELGANPEISTIGDKIAEAYLKLGAKLSFTCAPYLLESKPGAGEQIGWSESNAVVFANSVLGARTQKYPDYMDVFIALTGRAPYAGCHDPEGRKPNIIIQVPQFERFDQSIFPLLGYSIGHVVGAKIPFVIGLENTSPSLSDLKAFGAGFATTSSAPMFHIQGITPEAASFYDAVSHLERVEVTLEDLKVSWKQLNTAAEPFVDVIALGNPHFSVEEFCQLAELCRGKKKCGDVQFMVTTGRDTYKEALSLGYLEITETFGARLITDTCWCMIEEPVIPLKAKHIMTNSAKYAHYGPGIVGKKFHFGDIVACVNAACRGCRGDDDVAPPWLFRHAKR